MGKIKYIYDNDPDELGLDLFFSEDVYDNEGKLLKVSFLCSLCFLFFFALKNVKCSIQPDFFFLIPIETILYSIISRKLYQLEWNFFSNF